MEIITGIKRIKQIFFDQHDTFGALLKQPQERIESV